MAPSPRSDPAFSALGGGVNQAGSRAYNERLVLSLIRRNGPLPKADLARLTGLSAQTMSMIVRHLEEDGLLAAQTPVRGRVGQPSTPYAIAPHGALSFGLKIGRRSAELALCDFNGAIVDRAKQTYAYPVPAAILDFAREQTTSMRKRFPRGDRILGTGIAMPFELWKWSEEVEAPAGALDGWRDIDIVREVRAITNQVAYVENDATAACGAELARLDPRGKSDFLYIFIGSFAGGGIVINRRLFVGPTGNAGALGSMPVRVGGKRGQLINFASLIALEKAAIALRRDPSILQKPNEDWSALGKTLDKWIDTAAEALAEAIVTAVSVIDFPSAVIDGALPAPVRSRIVERTVERVATLNLAGLSPIQVVAGTIGADARVFGAAMLPIQAAYGAGLDVLQKDVAAR